MIHSPRVSSAALPAVLLLVLSACGERREASAPLSPTQQEAANAGYLSPPDVEAVRTAGEELVVEGAGPAGGRVRLAEAGRQTFSTAVDPAGRWRIAAPLGSDPRIFALAVDHEGRVLEAEGGLLVLPDGRAFVLRPGHGALPVARAPGSPEPRILSIDVASDGAAAVSGYAQPSSRAVTVVDGTPPAEDLSVGQGSADASGRFAIILASPLAPGPHAVVVNTPEGVARAQVQVTAPDDPGSQAFAARQAAGGWRISWRLPRGGVQTTYVLGPDA